MKLEAIARILDHLQLCMKLAEKEDMAFVRHLLDLARVETLNEMERANGITDPTDSKRPHQ